MALNILAVADGLAARFAAANVTPPTNPATGLPYPDIRESTARLPNNPSAFPRVQVYPPQPGQSTHVYSGGQRRSTFPFRVIFYFGEMQGDLERQLVGLYLWWGVLIDQLHAAMKLGLGGSGVLKAILTTSGVGVHTVAGVEHSVVQMEIEITTEDTVTLVP